MSTAVALQQAEGLLGKFAKGTAKPEPNRLDVTIAASDLVAAATALHRARWGYLATLTGVDLGTEANQIEAITHLCGSVREMSSPHAGDGGGGWQTSPERHPSRTPAPERQRGSIATSGRASSAWRRTFRLRRARSSGCWRAR